MSHRKKSFICCKFYLYFSVAFTAWWRQKLLEAVFAVQVTFLLNKTDVDEFTLAAGIHTEEVIGAPGTSQSSNEWASVGSVMKN
jgi:hypothetical protein